MYHIEVVNLIRVLSDIRDILAEINRKLELR